MAVQVTLAGRVDVEASRGGLDEATLGRPARVALAYLVCERHRPVLRDELAEAVWGETPPRSWEQLLRGVAVKLRAALAAAGLEPAAALSVAFGAYQLHLGADAIVDVEEAAAGMRTAEAALAADDPGTAEAHATRALAVARRQFLPGGSGIWVEHRQAELREVHLRALEVLASAAEAQKRWPAAVEAAEEAVTLEPFRESAHLRVMSAHAGAGNRAAALRAYERCRRSLADELGVCPSPQTEAAYLALLGEEPGPTAAQPPPGALPLPAPMAEVPGSFLVGREDEAQRLRVAFERAAVDGRQTVLLAGEPGIGKTALVSALARQSHASGARVLYGRCDEDLGAPYQPFAEALGNYVSHCPLAELEDHAHDHGGEIARLVPDVMRRLPHLPPPVVSDPEADRFRLFDAVGDLLEEGALAAPVVLVVDDLHWAGNGSLLLLRHLVRRGTSAPLLIVGTYRHTEVGSTHPLAAMLADLRRETGVERIRLDGLDPEGVAGFVQAAGTERAEGEVVAVARALHAHTAGNPFFVGELLRHLDESGGVYRREGQWTYYNDAQGLTVPEGVREVVARRLQRLGSLTNRSLVMASVIGADFQLGVLEAVVEGVERGAILDAVEEAVASHLIVELGHGRYRFSHAVVRDTIYSGLTATRRGLLHRRVGEVLEATGPGRPTPGLAALAHHFAEGAAAGCAGKAADYALAAARQALAQSAWEDAVTRLERGLEALSIADPPDHERRCDLLLLLAETWIRFFHPARTLTAAASAVAAARALGSVERFGWSAYRYIQAVGRTRDGDRRTAVEGAVAVADEALGLLGDDLPGLRARILAELVMLHEERGEASDAMSSEAVALARMSGDSDALGVVLATRCALLRGSPRIREHLALADELVRGAPPDGWDGWRNGYSQRAMARLALGDRRGFEADLKACGRLGVERHFWWFRWIAAMWTAGLGLLDGRFDEVEGLASHARGLAPAGLVGDEFFLRQMFRLQVERGDVAGATAVGRELVSSWPDNALHQAMLVAARAGFEGVDAARPDFERFADEGLGPMAPERWPVTLAYRAKVALALGGTERAGDLYDALRPYRAQAVIGGMADGCMGAADRYLGMLATATGNFDDAEAHFQAALTLESGLSSPPLLARTRFWYGRMLLLRARDRDVPEAKALLARALETAETLGMCGLADEVRAWC